ncbi:hypothetical protein RHDE110596_23955 [Prescottella defluvii]
MFHVERCRVSGAGRTRHGAASPFHVEHPRRSAGVTAAVVARDDSTAAWLGRARTSDARLPCTESTRARRRTRLRAPALPALRHSVQAGETGSTDSRETSTLRSGLAFGGVGETHVAPPIAVDHPDRYRSLHPRSAPILTGTTFAVTVTKWPGVVGWASGGDTSINAEQSSFLLLHNKIHVKHVETAEQLPETPGSRSVSPHRSHSRRGRPDEHHTQTVAIASAAIAVVATPATASAQEPYPVQYFLFVQDEFTSPGGSAAGSNDWSCKPTPEQPNPVVLVHGAGANRLNMWTTFAPLLANEGYCVFAPTFGNYTDQPYPISAIGGMARAEDSAAQIGDFVDEVLAAIGAARVDFRGISQGSAVPKLLRQVSRRRSRGRQVRLTRSGLERQCPHRTGRWCNDSRPRDGRRPWCAAVPPGGSPVPPRIAVHRETARRWPGCAGSHLHQHHGPLRRGDPAVHQRLRGGPQRDEHRGPGRVFAGLLGPHRARGVPRRSRLPCSTPWIRNIRGPCRVCSSRRSSGADRFRATPFQ